MASGSRHSGCSCSIFAAYTTNTETAIVGRRMFCSSTPATWAREQVAFEVAVIRDDVASGAGGRLDLAGAGVFDDLRGPAIGDLAIVAGPPVSPTDGDRELVQQRENPGDPRQLGVRDRHAGPIAHRATNHFARFVVEVDRILRGPAAQRASATRRRSARRRRSRCAGRRRR